MKEFNIVLAGVGGQGILFASRILGTASIKEGLNVRVSEIHGMAQRGGAVISNVRIGENVFAPTVLDGRADILLGFEPLETIRNLKFTSEKTFILMNDEAVPPPELARTQREYPSLDEIIKKIRRFTEKIVIIKAADLALKAGNILTRNVVMIGALAATELLPVKTESLREAVMELVPEKYLDMNLKAFDLGYTFFKEEKFRF
ncbi:indolepyruvate ferredoxin oxidoreductase subunit beta [Candidatus Bathyarchaeota archaeon]|nr:indolepyruvate ferredoxin oxidoreductase subunit beta [Candidatus Bathyarchaeota archaeon]